MKKWIIIICAIGIVMLFAGCHAVLLVSPPATSAPTEEPALSISAPTEEPTTAPTKPVPQIVELAQSYTVVISRDDFPIYGAPGYDARRVGIVETPGIYTIVAEYQHPDGTLWGKLKSNMGWVCVTDISNPQGGTYDLAHNQEYILPFSSTRLLTEKDVSLLSQNELRLARNEIYARHGRLFDNPELQAYFDSKSWYLGTITAEDFPQSILSNIEQANIQFISAQEAIRAQGDYPRVVCPLCGGWGTSITTGVGTEGITCLQCEIWIIEPFYKEDKLDTTVLWKIAYWDYINNLADEKDSCFYRLVYVDSDNIPELFIQGWTEAAGSTICSYKNGRVVAEHLRRLGGASYIPGSGLVRNCNGNMGSYSTDIYRLGNNGFTSLFHGLQEDSYEEIIDGFGEYDYIVHSRFHYDGSQADVTEEEFLAAQAEIFDFGAAEDFGGYNDGKLCSYSDIKQKIQNW